MLPGFVNHLINPDFGITDLGTAARTTSGYVVPRWKLELTGSPGVSAAPGTLPADIGQPKWLRGKPCLNLDVTTLAGADRVQVTQRIEGGERFSRQPAHVTVVAYGPDGGTLRFGVGGAYRTLTTRGATTRIMATFTESIEDPSTEYLIAEIEAKSTGLFKVGFVQVAWPDSLAHPPSPELRPRHVERLLLARYVYPLRRGLYAATGGTQQFLPVNFPVPMRAAPTLAVAASGIDVAELRSGTATTISPATVTVLDATTGGCRVRLTGTHSVALAATDGYLLTDYAAVLTADY